MSCQVTSAPRCAKATAQCPGPPPRSRTRLPASPPTQPATRSSTSSSWWEHACAAYDTACAGGIGSHPASGRWNHAWRRLIMTSLGRHTLLPGLDRTFTGLRAPSHRGRGRTPAPRFDGQIRGRLPLLLHGPQREALTGPLPGQGAGARGELRIGEIPAQPAGDAARVAGRRKDARDLVLDQLGDASDPRGDHGQPRRHRLQERSREPLPLRGERADIRGFQDHLGIETLSRGIECSR